MRRRPSSRLLLIDSENRVLLFRYVYRTAAAGSQDYWATPGGALEEGETFAEAARRELREETGMSFDDVGEPVAEKQFVLDLPEGQRVVAEERFFLVRAATTRVSKDGWTQPETEMLVDHRWWSIPELKAAQEAVYPEDLLAILARNGVS